MSREHRLSEVFITLADSLTADFNATDLLHFLADVSVELLDIDSAGIMLDDLRGHLQLAASSSDLIYQLERIELERGQGPCLDCFSSGEPVVNVSTADALQRWPHFSAAATAAGVMSVHALPLRLRGRIIGAMNVCSRRTETLSAGDLALGQALADMATIAILQERASTGNSELAEQLQSALNNKVLIEQAKGMLAERTGVTPAEAFETLRSHARTNNYRLLNVARDVLDGNATLSQSR
jgi:GAF domain-containing protein